MPIPFEHSTDGIVGKTFDVFGDGSVKVIATPGHSAGSITILVKNNDSSILIAGDTGYAADSWRSKRLPGPVKDKDRMLQALNWVADLESNGTKILASHDPEIMTGVIEL